MDLSTVRADIKNWERSFKSANGRDPTIQDIKDQPPIAEKYKLYKKLSKFAAAAKSAHSSSSQPHSDPPSTPSSSRPRVSQVQPSLILSKSRAIETTAPLLTFNPFSPQKNKGKQKQHTSIALESPSNPFGSPLYFKSKHPTQKRGPSPDPFPAIHPIERSTSTFAPKSPPPAPTSALSRARKRLRGEPVSPSPNKEKRQRAGSQATLPFLRLGLDSPTSNDEDDTAANSSIVNDSPVKAPAGGKSFKLLFEDRTAPVSLPKGKLKRAKTTPATSSLFGERPTGLLSSVEEYMDRDSGKTGQKEHYRKKAANGHSSASRTEALFMTKPLNQMQPTTNKHGKVDLSEPRKSAKRSLSDTDMELSDITAQPTTVKLSLLPPSPPPESSSLRTRYDPSAQGKGKWKAKNPVGRKKTKLAGMGGEDADDNADDETGVINNVVKVVDRTQTRHNRATQSAGEDLDFDEDSILGYSRPIGPRDHRTASLDLGSGSGMEKFEVNLPDELRRMLALESAGSKTRDIREERLVKGLVYGRRARRYDPIKGGEIWDVGEDGLRSDGEDFTRRDTEGEDDWEGEPIPWEVGEL